MSEKEIQNEVWRALSNGGCVLYRNNIGILKDEKGNYIRYGVCNPGGSDLLGWSRIVVKPDMVGSSMAVFTAIEVKTKNGRITNDQKNFLRVVQENGGISGVCRSVEDALKLIHNPHFYKPNT